jgi:phytol kinase
MIRAAFATAIIACILIFSEYLWRKAHIRGEFARKFVHIIAGSFIAFLPFWVSYHWIVVLGVASVVGAIVNRYTHLFHAIHGVDRITWGDVLSSIGGITCALIAPAPWIFAVAILHLALADGLAAVVGMKFSKNFYRIFDHKKSVLGTITFVACSLAIVLVGKYIGDIKGITFAWIILIPIISMLLENLGGYGLDNVTVPVAVLLILMKLS